ncbi:heterokaryon incompatibility protein-domain-containing protein [Phaeosphaeria sp. MPI-PUGE-AT-0046c]|nr:heterokaryon incompatibility protein-domain-containing protein [Phaeosphaeria sp. MPI-PUGE-AT-0046c]
MPLFNYEAELARVSAAQAYEMNLRGTMSSVWTWGMNLKWKNVRAILNPNWRCPHCGFLSFGYTEIEQLETGVKAGRECCSIVLEAVRSWHRNETKSVEGMHIFAWELGYSDVPVEVVGCSVLLRWPHQEYEDGEPWRPSYDATINIFKSGPANNATAFVSKVPFVERTRPSGDTGSEEALGTIKQWIHNCSTHHNRYCTARAKSHLPKRVLELSHGSLHLRENVISEEVYACLSHCWGTTGPALTLTRETIGKLKDGIPTAELPRTFREVTELCLKLHIRYLWIDALCIIQQDKDDWQEAAATMASIYENAFVTIAATRSRDSEDGLFSTLQGFDQATRLKQSELYACKRRIGDFPQTSYSLLAEDGPWPLLRRAWVFQERLLSTRIIHFTNYQVIWECKSMQESETGDLIDDWSKDDYEPKSQKSSSLGPVDQPFKFPQQDKGYAAWQRIVAHYSHLKLTFPGDRLPAIAAIAQRTMRSRKDDAYIAGMWKNSLLHDLAWYRVEYRKNLARHDDSKPTWSWASAPGAVGFYNVTSLPSTELLAVKYTADGPEHIGEVRDARIKVRGRVLDITLIWRGGGEQDIRRGDDEQDMRWDNGDLRYDLDPKIPRAYDHLKPMLWTFCPDCGFTPSHAKRPDTTLDKSGEEAFSILFLWHNASEHRWFGLVLRRQSEKKVYERVGIANLSYFDPPASARHVVGSNSAGGPKRGTCAEMIEYLPLGECLIV